MLQRVRQRIVVVKPRLDARAARQREVQLEFVHGAATGTGAHGAFVRAAAARGSAGCTSLTRAARYRNSPNCAALSGCSPRVRTERRASARVKRIRHPLRARACRACRAQCAAPTLAASPPAAAAAHRESGTSRRRDGCAVPIGCGCGTGGRGIPTGAMARCHPRHAAVFCACRHHLGVDEQGDECRDRSFVEVMHGRRQFRCGMRRCEQREQRRAATCHE